MSPTYHLSPIDHPALALIREAQGLTLPALSALLDIDDPEEIAAVKTNWLDWLWLHPAEAAGCDSWIESLDLFWGTSIVLQGMSSLQLFSNLVTTDSGDR